jgi:TPR repeat protein
MIKTVITCLLVFLLVNCFAQEGDCYLQIVSDAGISVYVDGSLKGKTSASGLVVENITAGEHSLKLVKAGFKNQIHKITLASGEIKVFKVGAFVVKKKKKVSQHNSQNIGSSRNYKGANINSSTENGINRKTSVEKLKQLIDFGNSNAMVIMGDRFYEGRGVVKDYKKAFNLYKSAANSGNPRGQSGLAMLYIKGEGVEKNLEEGKRYNDLALESNDARAMYNMVYFRKNEAGTWLNKSVELNYYEALAVKGGVYSSESYKGKDYRLAIELFKKAAQQDYAPAFNKLAKMFLEGKGVKQDKFKGAILLEKGIELGSTGSCVLLGMLYDAGYGVTRDRVKAFKYYMMAAQKNNEEAQYLVGSCYMQGKGVEKDDKKAVYWLGKSFLQGSADSAVLLGILFGEGRGVKKDLKNAFKCFKVAAEKNEANGQYLLANCYNSGEGVERDYEKAFYWYKKSAEQDYLRAITMVGMYYCEGSGVTENKEEGKKWLKRAMDRGSKDAKEFYEIFNK